MTTKKKVSGDDWYVNAMAIIDSFPKDRGYRLCQILYDKGLGIRLGSNANFSVEAKEKDPSFYAEDTFFVLQERIEEMQGDLTQFLMSDKNTRDLLSIFFDLANHITEEFNLPVWDDISRFTFELETALGLYDYLNNKYMEYIKDQGIH